MGSNTGLVLCEGSRTNQGQHLQGIDEQTVYNYLDNRACSPVKLLFPEGN